MIFMNGIPFRKHLWHLDELLPQLTQSPQRFIKECCEQYQARVYEVAKSIAENPYHKIVMLAGPSGSGKTTSARYLKEGLEHYGVSSLVVSLDDFYLGYGKAPRLKNGDFDYESVYALDVPQLQSCLLSLIDDGSCMLPQFDFNKSAPKEEKLHIKLNQGDLIIFEGIHALNPVILECLPAEYITKIYVSVETTIFGCHNTIIPPREIRLARRMVRDSIYRNSDAYRTLHLWSGVVEGEEKYLVPFKDEVDYTLSTFHEFEPAILKPYLLPLLHTVTMDYPNYELAFDLKQDYDLFPVIESSLLPNDCLIHEFIK